MYKHDDMKNQIFNVKSVMMKLHRGEKLTVGEKNHIVQFYLEMTDICATNETFTKEFDESLNIREVSA